MEGKQGLYLAGQILLTRFLGYLAYKSIHQLHSGELVAVAKSGVAGDSQFHPENRTQCIDSSFTVQHFCRLARNSEILEIDDYFVKSFN